MSGCIIPIVSSLFYDKSLFHRSILYISFLSTLKKKGFEIQMEGKEVLRKKESI